MPTTNNKRAFCPRKEQRLSRVCFYNWIQLLEGCEVARRSESEWSCWTLEKTELCLDGGAGEVDSQGHCWTKKIKCHTTLSAPVWERPLTRPFQKKKKVLEVPYELLTLFQQEEAEFMVQKQKSCWWLFQSEGIIPHNYFKRKYNNKIKSTVSFLFFRLGSMQLLLLLSKMPQHVRKWQTDYEQIVEVIYINIR